MVYKQGLFFCFAYIYDTFIYFQFVMNFFIFLFVLYTFVLLFFALHKLYVFLNLLLYCWHCC